LPQRLRSFPLFALILVEGAWPKHAAKTCAEHRLATSEHRAL
jgi:hypothetical protein